MQPRLNRLINGRWPLRYIGRPRRASPAEGSSAWHNRNQQAITEHAFNFETEVAGDGRRQGLISDFVVRLLQIFRGETRCQRER
jgi:hypothetical protein